MGKIGWMKTKAISKLFGRETERTARYLRSQGVTVGKNAHIYSDVSSQEPYLITIGNDVTISSDVMILTHDASVSKVIPGSTDIFGEVHIGDNVFIGAKSILLLGVSLPDNTIVAAGSVVTKSPAEPGMIIGGNPAKVIGSANSLAGKYREYAVDLRHTNEKDKKRVILNSKKISK